MSPKNSEELLVNQIIEKITKIHKTFICPFCADEYLFDFSIKNHILKSHKSEIINLHLEFKELCPYCEAIFQYHTVIPKHILNSHGRQSLNRWMFENKEKNLMDKEIEASILYVPGSPGLTEFLDDDTFIKTLEQVHEEIQPINEQRKTSVRRSLYTSYNETEEDCLSRDDLKTLPKTKTRINWKKLFLFHKEKKVTRAHNSSKNIITSTPINFLDDTGLDQEKKNWKNTIRQLKNSKNYFLPLIGMFECGICKKGFENNEDLLSHSRENHQGLKTLFSRKYKCGQCGSKYFRHDILVRHCNYHELKSPK